VANGKLGLVVNPMSGRDVRRLAAHATNMTHEAKRDIVARVASGADAMGVSGLYITQEPFRISSLALEYMNLDAQVHTVAHKLQNSAADTELTVAAFREAGCGTFVSLGGDGTNRAIVRTIVHDGSAVDLVPLSTGTNNVFPVLAEPTMAGVVAGLNARGLLPDAAAQGLKQRAKVIHVTHPGGTDVGLIDAVLLRDDHVGNFLPFDADKIEQIVLTRAEPNSIGMSPIGGFLQPVYAEDDHGLLVTIDPQAPAITAPLSPGLFKPVHVGATSELAYDVTVPMRGPGVIALDGDRDIKLRDGEHAQVTIRRDGPWVLNVEATMRWATSQGIMAGK